MTHANVKILVCCHKKDIMATEAPYFPIHVGKALSDKDLSIQPDNEGENISHKNQSYCELTGMYWAWKNLKNVDVIGLCHYRRYFDFHNQCRKGFPQTNFPTEKFESLDLSIPQKYIDKVSEGKVIVAKPKLYTRTLVDDYCFNHISEDLRTLEKIIVETQPENIRRAYFNIMIQGHKLRHFNMFIMKWQDFDQYCSWLFPLLKSIEEKTDISHYDSVQKRIYGYIAERLFNVWLEAQKKDLVEQPVIWFTEAKDNLLHYNIISYKLKDLKNSLAFKLLLPRFPPKSFNLK